MKTTDKLTPHFTYGEVIKSSTAAKNGIDNSIKDTKTLDTAIQTCQFMELVRALFPGCYVLISRFYACLKLNRLLGSKDDSQHVKAEAVDFTVPGVPLKDAFLAIINSGLEYDQIIYEFKTWIHISHTNRYKNRRQALVAVKENGKTVYIPYKNQNQLV